MLTEGQKKALLVRINAEISKKEKEMCRLRSAMDESGLSLQEDERAAQQVRIRGNVMSLKRTRKCLSRLYVQKTAIESGSFEGVCEDCLEDIPIRRLIEMPSAVCCLECQEKREQKDNFHTGGHWAFILTG